MYWNDLRWFRMGFLFLFFISGVLFIRSETVNIVVVTDFYMTLTNWMVPKTLYSLLKQQAILLKPSDKRGAQAFLKYLKSSRAHNAIESSGYILPQ